MVRYVGFDITTFGLEQSRAVFNSIMTGVNLSLMRLWVLWLIPTSGAVARMAGDIVYIAR